MRLGVIINVVSVPGAKFVVTCMTSVPVVCSKFFIGGLPLHRPALDGIVAASDHSFGINRYNQVRTFERTGCALISPPREDARGRCRGWADDGRHSFSAWSVHGSDQRVCSL